MNIWLVTIGEPVPIGEFQADRLHRTGYFAHFLSSQGHQVTWWTSTFDHFRKTHHFNCDTRLEVDAHLTLQLLNGGGYNRNASLARFCDHRRIGKKFSALIAKEPHAPDLIVSALPTVELCRASVIYGAEHALPVVLDMRDMWPDIFVDMLPRLARPLARLLFHGMFRDAKWTCGRAMAITGITEEFVEWGLKRGGRQRQCLDKSFPLAYVSTSPPPHLVAQAKQFWDERGIRENDQTFTACFFGTLGRTLDLMTVINAARCLQQTHLAVRFMICGTGDCAGQLHNAARGLPNVVFPGWVDEAAMHVLMRRSHVGLDPLPNRRDFLATVNNKAIQYFSAGLPVISSPTEGTLWELLRAHASGLSYPNGDAQALADVLSRLSEDRAGLARMSANAADLFSTTFRAEVVYRSFMEYLDKVVRSQQSRV